MQLTFPVVSRFKTGEVFEPVVFERKWFQNTRAKIIQEASVQGWMLEHGCERSVQESGGFGGLVFVSADMTRRINLEFGSKGQITWLCITNPAARDRVVRKDRYDAVVGELFAGRAAKAEAPAQPVVPDIPAAPKPEVLAFREIACLKAGGHVTLRTLNGSVEVIIQSVHAGDSSEITKAYAVGVERHTRVEVTIRASHIAGPAGWRLYSIDHRWHDDQV